MDARSSSGELRGLPRRRGARAEADVAPSLIDDLFLGEKGDLPDGAYFALISGGSDAKTAMPAAGAIRPAA